MITITIKTDNAAFADDNYAGEVARILSRLSHDVLTRGIRLADHKLRDSNGNTVGVVKVSGPDRW